MKKRTRKPRQQRIVTPDTSTLHPIKLPPIAMVEAPMPQAPPPKPMGKKIKRWFSFWREV
jgi:hypothetical protein